MMTIGNPGARGLSSRVRWPLLVVGAFGMIARAPELLLSPRLWAEEGRLFFAFAFQHSFAECLRTPFLDYYQLVPIVLAKAAAACVPLERAPLVTTLGAWLVQVLPLALIAFSRAELWSRPLARAVGILFLVVSPTGAEVWLTSLHAQYHLAVAAFLVLVDDGPAPSPLRALRVLTLLLSVLNGVVASFLAPLFLLRAWGRGRRDLWLEAAVMVLGAAFQAGWMLTAAERDPLVVEHLARRFSGSDLPEIVAVMVFRILAVPLLGRAAAEDAGLWLREAFLSGGAPASLLAGTAVGIALLCATPLLREPLERRMVLACLLTAFLSTLGALGDKVHYFGATVGQRYFHAPTSMAVLLLLRRAFRARAPEAPWKGAVPLAVLAWVLVLSAMDARGGFPDPGELPRWTEEVARWRADPRRQIRIWPEGWTLSLVAGESPAARVTELGRGAAPAGLEPPRLEASAPTLGQRVLYRLEGAPPGARGALFASSAPLSEGRPLPGLEGGGLWLAPGASTVVAEISADAGGRWSFAQAVPEAGWLPGSRVTIQAVIDRPHLAISNALELLIGR